MPEGRSLVVEVVVEGPQVVSDVLAATTLPDDQGRLHLQEPRHGRRAQTSVEKPGSLDRRHGAPLADRWLGSRASTGSGQRASRLRRARGRRVAGRAGAATRTDGLDTLFSYPPGLPTTVIDAGLLWMVWTANDPRAIEQCIRDGAGAITTDNTGRVRAWMDAAGIATASVAEVNF